ncbi:MAG: hypothetical protein JO001_03555 [Alphaproteobacteria bacterium]|nr:hypothetical protein [Alphaproteobacteria bacterium]
MSTERERSTLIRQQPRMRLNNPRQIEPSPDDTACQIAYARRKFGEERWPYSAELRPVREGYRAAISEADCRAGAGAQTIRPEQPGQRKSRRR